MGSPGVARRAEDFAGQSFPRAQPWLRRQSEDRARGAEIYGAAGLPSGAAARGRQGPAAADLPAEGQWQVRSRAALPPG